MWRSLRLLIISAALLLLALLALAVAVTPPELLPLIGRFFFFVTGLVGLQFAPDPRDRGMQTLFGAFLVILPLLLMLWILLRLVRPRNR